MASFSFVSGDLVVNGTVTEVGGDLVFTLTVDASTGTIGDLRGFFIEIDEALFGGGTFTGSGADITGFQAGAESVSDLGNGANMNGAGDTPYDIGFEIGTPGQTPDDIQSTTFTLSYTGGALSITDLEELGLRINSIGLIGGERDGSLKLPGGEVDILPTGGQITLTVEEEDGNLPLGGNEDTMPGDDADLPGDFDNTTDMDQDQLVFTAGTYALTSFAFGDLTGLEKDTDGNPGTDELFWFQTSATQIVGYIDGDNTTGTAAVQIDLMSIPVSIAPGASGGPTVKLTLLDNLLHDPTTGNIEDVLNLGSINVIATDTDGNTAQGTAFFREIDDVPVADIADGGGDVTIDESAGLQTQADGNQSTATEDDDDDDVLGTATLGGVALTTVFGGVSNPGSDGSAFEQYALSSTPLVSITGSSVGADTEGATTVLSLAVADSDSELSTTDGKAIKLFLEDGVVVGRYDATTGLLADVDSGDPAAFAIAIGQDGKVAVVQYVSLENPTFPNDFDEPVDLTGKVNAVVTVTDGDGDKATASTGIGDQIFFEDDGPVAAIADGGGDVTIDESAGLQTQADGNQSTATEDDDDDDVLGTAMLGGVALSVVFGSVANPGSDGSAFEQYALSSTPLVSIAGSDVGQDDEGSASTVISLEIADSDSELSTTDGKAIKLFLEDGVVVGRYDATTGLLADVDSGDPAAFAIAIGQDGKVAVVQYVSLENPTFPNDFDEPVDLTGKVNAVVTVTDGDGDKATASTGIGDQIFFEDDGPLLDGTTVDDSINSLVFAANVTDSDSYDFDVGQDDEDAPGIQLIDFTDPDDAGDLAASGLDDLEALLGDITAVQTGNTVTYFSPDGDDPGTEPDKLFELTVDDSGWSFEIFQNAPLIFSEIDFSQFKSGGPRETIEVQSDVGTTAVFDGWLFGGTDGRKIDDRMNNPGGTTDDDLNPDNLGFGIRGGQASNINNNEGFGVTFLDGATPKTVTGLQFKINQQGNTDDVAIAFQLTNSGGPNPTLAAVEGATGFDFDSGTVGDGAFFVYTELPGGNNEIIFTIVEDNLQGTYVKQANEIVVYVDGKFDDSLFKMTYPQDDGDPDIDPDDFYTDQPFENDSVRVKDVTLIEVADVPDVSLSFDIKGTDGDGDMTQVETFDVFITDDGGAIV